MQIMQTSPWNSLEIAKIIAGLLTPIALATLGVYLHRVTKRYEHLQWRSQKLIEKRLSIYDSLAPKINDLYCYFTYVGAWRDMSPASVVALKRTIDKEIHLAAPLFSNEFLISLMAFQETCFETYNGWGRDACIRSEFEKRKTHYKGDWQPDFDILFSENISSIANVKIAYAQAMQSFSKDIGVHEHTVTSGR